MSEEQSEKFNPSIEKPLSSQDYQTSDSKEHSLLTEIVKSTDECSKMRARLNFLISRIDPLDVDMPTTIVDNNQSQTESTSCLNAPASLQMNTLETNYNYSQPGSVIYTTPAPTMFFPIPPTIVVDTYQHISREVYHPI